MTPLRTDCVFCRIVAGDPEVPAWVVARAFGAVAFLPNRPAALGHVLVAPVAHCAGVWDAPIDAWSAAMQLAWWVAPALRVAFAAEGVNVIQSTGEVASQTVRHLHVHVVPRWADDSFPDFWTTSQDADEMAKGAVAGAVAVAIRTAFGAPGTPSR